MIISHKRISDSEKGKELFGKLFPISFQVFTFVKKKKKKNYIRKYMKEKFSILCIFS